MIRGQCQGQHGYQCGLADSSRAFEEVDAKSRVQPEYRNRTLCSRFVRFRGGCERARTGRHGLDTRGKNRRLQFTAK